LHNPVPRDLTTMKLKDKVAFMNAFTKNIFRINHKKKRR
jgi:hypothetical protein